MLLNQLPSLNTPYDPKLHQGYFLNIHQQILDSIPDADSDDHAIMQDIAAAWGSCRAYQQVREHGDAARIKRVEKAIYLNLQMEKILNYGEVASMDRMQQVLFPQRVAILNALRYNNSLDDINPLADVSFSYWLSARLRTAFLGMSLQRMMSGSLFGLRSQRDAFAKKLLAFPADDERMMMKEHHLRQGSMLLEYLSIRAKPSQPAESRLLIRVEGRNVHYAQRTRHYAEDFKCINDYANHPVDMIVLNHVNVSTSSSKAAKNIDELAAGVSALIDSCIQQGYKPENMTLLGTCAGSQITSYFAATNLQKYPIKCISDRSFSSFEQVVRGHIEHIRLAVRPNSNRPIWQYILLRILWFPLWVGAESVTRSLYAMLHMYLWASGWKLQQATHINALPLHRLQVFQAKAFNTAYQLDDKALPHAHIAHTLEERRLDVLAYLASLSKQPNRPACLQRVRNFIEKSYQVYTEDRNSRNKPHDPHLSPLHALRTHEENKPYLEHIAHFVSPTTTELDALAQGLPPTQYVPRYESIHSLLVVFVVGMAYGVIQATASTLIPLDIMKMVLILAVSYCAYDFCYSYIEASCSYFQGARKIESNEHYTVIKADTIRFAAPLLVRMEAKQRTEFIRAVGVDPMKVA